MANALDANDSQTARSTRDSPTSLRREGPVQQLLSCDEGSGAVRALGPESRHCPARGCFAVHTRLWTGTLRPQPDPAAGSSAVQSCGGRLAGPCPVTLPPGSPLFRYPGRVAECRRVGCLPARRPLHLNESTLPGGVRASVGEIDSSMGLVQGARRAGAGVECGPWGIPCRPRETRRLLTRGQQRFRGPTSGSSKLPPNDHRPRTGPAGLGSARPPEMGLPPVHVPALDNGLEIYRRPE